jgi:hypothetical protein
MIADQSDSMGDLEIDRDAMVDGFEGADGEDSSSAAASTPADRPNLRPSPTSAAPCAADGFLIIYSPAIVGAAWTAGTRMTVWQNRLSARTSKSSGRRSATMPWS